jgi:hypothetical protein
MVEICGTKLGVFNEKGFISLVNVFVFSQDNNPKAIYFQFNSTIWHNINIKSYKWYITVEENNGTDFYLLRIGENNDSAIYLLNHTGKRENAPVFEITGTISKFGFALKIKPSKTGLMGIISDWAGETRNSKGVLCEGIFPLDQKYISLYESLMK